MKKIVLLMICCISGFTLPAVAESSMDANFKRVSLLVLSVNTGNNSEYRDNRENELSADDRLRIRALMDFVLEYENSKLRWDNGIFLAYDRNKYYYENRSVSFETEDTILLSSDAFYMLFEPPGFDLGPFFRVEYETEFVPLDNEPRESIWRGVTGARLSGGEFIQFENVYAALVGQSDNSDRQNALVSFAWMIGVEASMQPLDNIRFTLDTYFLNFFYYDQFAENSLRYDFRAESAMNVRIIGALSISPSVILRHAQSRGASKPVTNITIGVSLNFSDSFNIW